MLMLTVKHWNARFAQKEPTVLVGVCASTTGISCPLDLKVAFLVNIMQVMGTTVNISRKRKVATAQSKYDLLLYFREIHVA